MSRRSIGVDDGGKGRGENDPFDLGLKLGGLEDIQGTINGRFQNGVVVLFRNVTSERVGD